MHRRSLFRGCLLGLACGDAVGTAVEFQPRGSFVPLADMTGGGPFGLRPGQWTDDTSMALCLASSLVELERFDPVDQIARYVRWRSEGYWSSTGSCFDIGATVAAALDHFERSGDPLSGATDPRSAGNGSIMRLAPVPMFFYPERQLAIEMAGASSRTTHGAAECVDACRLLAAMLCQALSGASKEQILSGHGLTSIAAPKVQAIARGEYRGKTEADIRGSGYVIESLEAALWCFDQTDSFESAILAAANLGDDADTTAAVCGQIAGAFYGEGGIPKQWRDRLAMSAEIRELADALHALQVRAHRHHHDDTRHTADDETADTAQNITTFLMFDGHAEEAMNFYVSLFPDSEIVQIDRYGPDEAGEEGTLQRGVMSLHGQSFICIDSPVPHNFSFTPAISLHVSCQSEDEVKRIYRRLSDGGEVLMPLDTYPFCAQYAWLNDRYGVSWQLALAE